MNSEIHLPKIAVIGVGGAGINIVKHMQELGLDGVDFIVANTDAQSLAHVEATKKIYLGKNLTRGFGAGGDAVIGEKSAEESLDEIIETISPYQMIFITAGMGGGTGSGASSIIGKVAKDQGILSVGIITRPFEFEGRKRTAIADEAIAKFRNSVDAFVVLQNEKLFELFDDDITQLDAFLKADELITNSLKGLTDILTSHGQINLDFADLRAILKDAGQIVLNSAVSDGEERAKIVSKMVLENKLLDQGNIAGANQVLIQISGGNDVKLKEVKEITDSIREHLPHFGNLIFGTNFKEEMNGKIHISLIASGLDESEKTIQKEEEIKQEKKPSSLASFVFSSPKKTEEIIPVLEKKVEEEIISNEPIKEEEKEKSSLLGDFDDLKKFFAFETQTNNEAPKTEEKIEEKTLESFTEKEDKNDDVFLTEELIIEETLDDEGVVSTDENSEKVEEKSNSDLLKMLGEIEQNKNLPDELEIPSFLRDKKE